MSPLLRKLLLPFALTATLAASPHDFEVDGIYYDITSSSDNTAAVTFRGSSYNSYSNEYSGSVIIPSSVEYNGKTYAVTFIGHDAFRYCASLASVVIPNSVTSIGNDAFYYCSSLTSVEIPNSVTSIGNYAFYGCSSLESLAFNATNCATCGSSYYPAFPSSISSLTIGDNVTKIPDYFLYNGCKIQNLSIPNSVTSIGSYAFRNCASLASVEIPNSVTSIGNDAFYGCSSLASVVIPNSVTSIGDDAFYGCSGLKKSAYPSSISNPFSSGFKIAYPSDCLIDEAGVIYDKDITKVYYAPMTLSDGYTIPNTITSIGFGAFAHCTSLASVVIPNAVTSIGKSAFLGCFSLASVEIPNAVTSIGDYAFDGCSSLTSVVIPNAVTSIGGYAFRDCSSLESLAFNATNCATCGSSYYPAFPSSISSLTIGDNVTKIPDYFLYNGSKIQGLTIPNSVTSIGERSFYENRLKSVTFGSGLLSIGSYAFTSNNHRIAKAFWLGNTPPSGYGEVNAYVNYVSNDQYNLNNQIKYQFLSSKFTVDGTIYVPVSPSERTCDVVDCLYNPTYTTPVISDKVTNKGIEMTVNNIRQYSFYNNSNIESLTLSNIGFVGSYAFYNCGHLTSLTASNKGDIGNDAFRNCSKILTANVSNNGNIGEDVFQGCESLQTVTLANNGSIGSSAFYGCTALQTATIKNTGNIGNSSFYGCTSLQTATIENKGNIGECAFYNDKALNQVKLGNEVTGISENAFYGCSAIPEIVIPNSVTSLGASAFQGCSALKSATLGAGFPSLPTKVFSGCSSLESISIPNNVTSISDYAFEGCSSLSDISIEDDDKEAPEIEEPTNIQYPDWTSSNHADNSESHQEYLLDAKAGAVLTFNYSVDSESGYDFFIAKINGSEAIKASGKKSDSFRYQFSEAGQITLYLSYTKDSSSNSGQDRVVVSDIWLKGASSINTAYITLGSNGSSPLFADCPLDEVYIGRKLSYKTGSNYGYSPFYRNTSLRTVEITDAETEIYDNEFYGCSGLNSLKIGNGVKKIGKWAFSGCSSLDYFSAGYNVESIGDEAFSDCTGLTKYYSYSIVPPVCGNQALDDINKWECALYVPAESSDEYRAAPQWKDFFFVEEMSAVLVAAIELNATEAEVNVGSTLQLSATILPANATNQALVWESSDVSVADVDGDGLVTGLKEGTATITVRSADGNAEATCVLTVKDMSGIDTVNAPSAYTLVKTPDGYIVRNACGARIEVYSADGRMVYLAPSYTEEEIALPAGLYIVRAANRAWKVRF